MSKKEMIALVNKTEELKDENHRLMIERDHLKNRIDTIEAETTDRILTEDIVRLDVQLARVVFHRAAA